MVESGSPIEILFNLLLFVTGYAFIRKAAKKRGHLSKRNRNIMFCFCLIFCLFSFWGGDYFNYKIEFSSIRAHDYSTLEDFYVSLANFIPNSYFLFRLIVWGSAVVLLFQLFKISKDYSAYSILFFFSLYIPWFSYARVSLAMSTMFLGGLMIVKGVSLKNSKRMIIVGLLLLIASFYLHRTATYGIVIVLFSILFRKFNKISIFILVILVPVIVIIAKSLLSQFMELSVGEEQAIDVLAGQKYMQNDVIVDGPGMILGNILQRTPFYMALCLFVLTVLDGTYKHFPEETKFFANASFLIIFTSSFFLFDLGVNTSILYYRFQNFAMIPTALLLAYCYSTKYRCMLVRTIFNVGSFAAFYAILYAFYCSFM